MSQINVNRIKDSNEGAPDFPSGVNVSGITSTVTLGVTNLNTTNVNVSGVVTATTLDGNLLATGTPTLGLGVTINASGVNISGVATAGIVSATTLYGDGANITGIALTIAPLNYNPAVYGVDLAHSTGIGLTFNQRVFAGVGTVTLSLVSIGSTVAEVIGIGTALTKTYTVTVAGGKYYLDGNQQYSPTLYPGGIYTFDQSAGTNGTHPLRFATAADAAGSTEYTTGVETNGTPGSSGAYTRITVAADAPDTLYYYCTNHSGMGSNVSIGNNVSINNDGTLPKLSFTPVSSLSGDSVIFVDIPSGSITTIDGTSMSATNWTFTTKIPLKLFTWGTNNRGQLGHNQADSLKISSPTQVGSSSGWNALTGEAFAVLATKDNGQLWVWGDNEEGNLGMNNRTGYSSPVQVPGTNWAHCNIGDGEKRFLATKTDGTLWTWGDGMQGQLGNDTAGNNSHYSSPVQIPGTTWNTTRQSITNNSYTQFALKS